MSRDSEETAKPFDLPATPAAVARHCTLDEADRVLVFRRRGAHNRLGFSAQMCALRYPGRLLTDQETPPDEMLRFLAEQVDALPQDFEAYLNRRPRNSRQRHITELLDYLSLRRANLADRRDIMKSLEAIALENDDPANLTARMLSAFRNKKCVIPGRAVIERDCRTVLTRARHAAWDRLAEGLDNKQAEALNALLASRGPDGRVSLLAWLRHPPQAARPGCIGRVFDRMAHIRTIGVDQSLRDRIPRQRFDTLVEEARRVPVQHLAGKYGIRRKRALLIAAAIDIEEALSDLGIELMGRYLRNLFNRNEHEHAAKIQASGGAITRQLDDHVALVNALVTAKTEGADPMETIEALIGWGEMIESAEKSGKLTEGHAFNSLSELENRYKAFRPLAARFLKIYRFVGVTAAADGLRAIDSLRTAWASNHKLESTPPIAFVSPRWRNFVFKDGDAVDHRYYTFCAFETLFSRLRAGDVWTTVRSQVYAAFDAGMVSKPSWDQLVSDGTHGLVVETDFETFRNRITDTLHRRLSAADKHAAAGTLPNVNIDQNGLHISRLEGLETAKEAEPFARRLYDCLPVIRITDLLVEVDRWSSFSKAFTHLRTGREANSRLALFSAILADGTNRSYTRTADATEGLTARKLAWMVDWHIRPDTYANALAKVVNLLHHHPLAEQFGKSDIGSSDGQFFPAGSRGKGYNLVNAKHDREPGGVIYTHITSRYAPIQSRLVREGGEVPYVLPGLLDHRCDLNIKTQHVDTGGTSDHLMAVADMLGIRIAARIRNLSDRRLYSIAPQSSYPTLKPLIEKQINMRVLESAWSDMLRFATSIKTGAIPPALSMKRLAAWPKQNSIAAGMREYGRIVRTLFILDWIENPELRRQATEELNKGEARNTLARAVFYHRLGELRERSALAQANRTSGLNLVVTSIILWNTVYLDLAIKALQQNGEAIPHHLIPHLAPLGWEHIILTGDVNWQFNLSENIDGYLPLKNPDPRGVAA